MDIEALEDGGWRMKEVGLDAERLSDNALPLAGGSNAVAALPKGACARFLDRL